MMTLRRMLGSLVTMTGVMSLVLGCPGDDGSAGDHGGTDTGGACVDDFLVPPAGHPNPAGVFTGIDVEGDGYTRMAVGHVDDNADSAVCCQDYALVNGPDLNTVRVVFGAPGTGLQAFADMPDEVIPITSRMEDIVMADFDGDNRNDIAVVTASAFYVVMHTGSSSSPFFGQPTGHSGVSGSARAGKTLTTADVDCDGDTDLVAASTSSDHLVVLPWKGSGFGGPYSIPTGSGMRAQRVITTDVDSNGIDDLVISTDDGRVGVYVGGCRGGFTAKGPYSLFPGQNTTDMAIAAGLICPGHPNDIAIAVGYFDRVRLMCGDGSGEFGGVFEPHGQQPVGPADYAWSVLPGDPLNNRIQDLAFWSPTRELFALYNPTAQKSALNLLDPDSCKADSRSALVAELESGAPFDRLDVHTEGAGPSTTWDRFSVVGSPGLGVGR